MSADEETTSPADPGSPSGPSGASTAAQVLPQLRRVGRRARREATKLLDPPFEQLAPRQAVRFAYNVLLRRDPDEPAWS